MKSIVPPVPETGKSGPEWKASCYTRSFSREADQPSELYAELVQNSTHNFNCVVSR